MATAATSRPAEQQRSRRRLAFPAQVADITLMQLANWRWSWRRMVVLGVAAPLISATVVGAFARQLGPRTVESVLVGNVVLALMFEMQSKVASHFAFLRTVGALTYFASLPIAMSAVVLATSIAFLLLAAPAVTATAVVGASALGVRLEPSWWLLLVTPACALPLAAIGALIGTAARTVEEASAASQVVLLLSLIVGPVLLPPASVPAFAAQLAVVNPAAYAASALRQTLIGPVGPRLAVDLAALAVIALAGHAVAWRVVRSHSA